MKTYKYEMIMRSLIEQNVKAGGMNFSKIQMSITLDREQVKWMDEQIDRRRFASRSHCLGYCLQALMENEQEKE